MNEEDIKRLIEKYYNGESTSEEEGALKLFFRKNDPEGFETEKAIFSYYAEQETIPEPLPGFEARILAGIDAAEINGRSRKASIRLKTFLGAAAGLILFIGLCFLLTTRSDQADTYSNPEIAYAETIKILKEVSSQLNRGASALEPVGKINEISNRSIKTMAGSARIVEKNLNFLQKDINRTTSTVDKNIKK